MISIVILKKISLHGNLYGELLFQLWHWRKFNLMAICVENYYFSCDAKEDLT